MLVSVDIVDKDNLFKTTKNPSFEGLSDLTDIKRYYNSLICLFTFLSILFKNGLSWFLS